MELAARQGYVPLEELAAAQALPTEDVRAAMRDLRRAGIVASKRGHDGGYALDRAADAVTLADIIRAVDGPLTEVRGERPDDVNYRGAAEPLRDEVARSTGCRLHSIAPDAAHDHQGACA